MRPRILDDYCGAGGASKGYDEAGFAPYGIDNKPMPRYPYPFLQMDALEALDRLLAGEGLTFSNGETLYLRDFAAIHASPPCQGYSKLASMHPEREWPLLLEDTRSSLQGCGLPYVIENVETAPMIRRPSLEGGFGMMLCGSMFGLGVERGYLRRHRLFETTVPVSQPACNHQGRAVGVYGHGGHSGKDRMLYREEAALAMDIDWMNRDEMSEAIPPAYSRYIGTALLASLAVAR